MNYETSSVIYSKLEIHFNKKARPGRFSIGLKVVVSNLFFLRQMHFACHGGDSLGECNGAAQHLFRDSLLGTDF